MGNRVGLIGGMSWHSTVDYYRLVNAAVERELGGHHSADLVMVSVDFEQIRDCQVREDWTRAGELLAEAARELEVVGAGAVAICTNLMHKVAPAVEAAISVPLLHIADAVADSAAQVGATTLGLLGTRWVMDETFYADRLARHGVSVVAPEPHERPELDRIIWDELTLGTVTDTSRAVYRAAIEDVVARGAEAIVLGCTEIQLLVGADDSPVPVIDSMASHARALAEWQLGVRL